MDEQQEQELQEEQGLQKDWTAEQFQYIQWLSLTKLEKAESEEIPAKQAELAKTLGVSRRTLQRWKKIPGFQDAVYDEVRKHLDWRLPDILKALGDKAITGDVAAITLSLKVAGRYRESQELHFYEREYGADEFKKGSEYIKRWKQERFGERTGPDPDQGGEGAGEN